MDTFVCFVLSLVLIAQVDSQGVGLGGIRRYDVMGGPDSVEFGSGYMGMGSPMGFGSGGFGFDGDRMGFGGGGMAFEGGFPGFGAGMGAGRPMFGGGSFDYMGGFPGGSPMGGMAGGFGGMPMGPGFGPGFGFAGRPPMGGVAGPIGMGAFPSAIAPPMPGGPYGQDGTGMIYARGGFMPFDRFGPAFRGPRPFQRMAPRRLPPVTNMSPPVKGFQPPGANVIGRPMKPLDPSTVREQVRDNVGAVRDQIRDNAGAVRDHMRDNAGAVRDHMRDNAGAVRDHMRDNAGAVRDHMRDNAPGNLDLPSRMEMRRTVGGAIVPVDGGLADSGVPSAVQAHLERAAHVHEHRADMSFPDRIDPIL